MQNFFDLVIESFQYQFMQRAMIVGTLIALSSSVLGIFLVLKKYAMIGDGLAHVSFATVAIALFLQTSPLLISIPIVTIASIFIMKLNEKAGIHGDAAIGLVSSFSIAFGVMLTSISGGFNVDLYSYLFGSILAIRQTDVWFATALAFIVISMVLLFYNDLFAITHDESFAAVIGIKTKWMNYLIATLTSITIVLGIRVVGTMLISSMIIFPTVTALQASRSFRATIIIAALVSVASVFIGIIASFVFNFPSGASIVMTNALFFLLFYLNKLR